MERYARVSALPDAERFDIFADKAHGGPWTGYRDNPDPNMSEYIAITRNQAKRMAEDALVLARNFRGHPRHDTAIYGAHMTLASLAVREGDIPGAVEHIREASQVRGSEELAYTPGIALTWQWPVLRELVGKGEAEAVADFMTRMSSISAANRAELREAAAAIRRGESPRL